MEVDLIDHMGSDLTVVNAARVSFAKESKEFSDKDEKLINYLAKHNHWVLLDIAVCSFASRIQSLLHDNLSNTKSVWCGMKCQDDMWMTNQSSTFQKNGDLGQRIKNKVLVMRLLNITSMVRLSL